MSLHLTGDATADALLTDNPFALLVGMMLDQQVPMETAFAGPTKLQERLGSVDPATIANYDPAIVSILSTSAPCAFHCKAGAPSMRATRRRARPS